MLPAIGGYKQMGQHVGVWLRIRCGQNAASDSQSQTQCNLWHLLQQVSSNSLYCPLSTHIRMHAHMDGRTHSIIYTRNDTSANPIRRHKANISISTCSTNMSFFNTPSTQTGMQLNWTFLLKCSGRLTYCTWYLTVVVVEAIKNLFHLSTSQKTKLFQPALWLRRTYHLFNEVPLHQHVGIGSMHCVVSVLTYHKLTATNRNKQYKKLL